MAEHINSKARNEAKALWAANPKIGSIRELADIAPRHINSSLLYKVRPPYTEKQSRALLVVAFNPSNSYTAALCKLANVSAPLITAAKRKLKAHGIAAIDFDYPHDAIEKYFKLPYSPSAKSSAPYVPQPVSGDTTLGDAIPKETKDRLTELVAPEPASQRVEEKLVMERGAVYGHPLDNFTNIATAEAVLDKCPDVAVRHALKMIWLKVTRLVETPDHQDSIDDIKGYAETINMIHAERKRRDV